MNGNWRAFSRSFLSGLRFYTIVHAHACDSIIIVTQNIRDQLIIRLENCLTNVLGFNLYKKYRLKDGGILGQFTIVSHLCKLSWKVLFAVRYLGHFPVLT